MADRPRTRRQPPLERQRVSISLVDALPSRDRSEGPQRETPCLLAAITAVRARWLLGTPYIRVAGCGREVVNAIVLPKLSSEDVDTIEALRVQLLPVRQTVGHQALNEYSLRADRAARVDLVAFLKRVGLGVADIAGLLALPAPSEVTRYLHLAAAIPALRQSYVDGALTFHQAWPIACLPRDAQAALTAEACTRRLTARQIRARVRAHGAGDEDTA